MSRAFINEQYLTDIANAIRTVEGGTSNAKKYTPPQMADAISNIKTAGEDNSKMISMLDGTITDIDVPSGTIKIRKEAFKNCNSLKTVSVPSTVTTIANDAFLNTDIDKIDIDKDYNGIVGAPWGSKITAINWIQGTKYPVTITQSNHQTITVETDGLKYTDSFEYWKGATLNATVKAESGYDPGTLSQTTVTLSGPIAFTATEVTDWTGKPKFTVNNNNNKGPFYLKIGSDWYKLKYTNQKSEDSAVFDFIFMIIVIGFSIDIDYCDATTDGSITTKAITKDSFASGGVFYNYFTTHKAKFTRNSDGHGMIMTFASTNIETNDTYRSVTLSISSDNTVTIGTTDIINDFYTSYSNGEDFTLEFIEA